MFYDLNILHNINDRELPRTLAFAAELGYNLIALNHALPRLPADPACAIPDPLPLAKDLPKGLELRRRVTLTLSEPAQNARLAALAKQYDILALRPVDEKTLQLACSSYDCDIISLDLTQRLPFFFKFKTLAEAIRAGKRIEICYGQAVLGDAGMRRNLISNATQLIRATRGRGLLLSSGCAKAGGLRGPWDAVNLLTLWGLGQERGYEAVTKEARAVLAIALLKRTSYRGVIDVVYGGERPEQVEKGKEAVKLAENTGKAKAGQKRKADVMESDLAPPAACSGGDAVEVVDKPPSKRELKRRAKRAKLETALRVGARDVSAPLSTEESIKEG